MKNKEIEKRNLGKQKAKIEKTNPEKTKNEFWRVDVQDQKG